VTNDHSQVHESARTRLGSTERNRNTLRALFTPSEKGADETVDASREEIEGK
jgi:hypothetical protein